MNQNYSTGFPLVLSDSEKEQLKAYYMDTVKAEFLSDYPSPEFEDNHWQGIQIGDRMFDLCVYWLDGEIYCLVYECEKKSDGHWYTSLQHEWMLEGGGKMFDHEMTRSEVEKMVTDFISDNNLSAFYGKDSEGIFQVNFTVRED